MKRLRILLSGFALIAVATAAVDLSAQPVRMTDDVMITAIENGTESRPLELPLNKARILDLPADVRDVLVSSPNIADIVVKTPRQVYILGKAVGVTNVFFFDTNGRQMLRLELRVALDLTALRTALAELMPNEKISARAVNNTIVLTGKIRSAKAADDARLLARRFAADDASVINMIQVVNEQQVLLRVRVSEMKREVTKKLGINTSFGSRSGNITVTPVAGALDDRFSRLSLNFADIFGFGNRIRTFESLIDALESEGLTKTLAQPNLTAISGENAKFLVGGEFGYPVPQEGGTPAIQFKEFGIVVTFTPVVLSSGLISLRISAEISKLDGFVGDQPRLSIRRTETTVEIPSGGSLAIAGLLQNDNENTVDGLPYLKNIPVLGALFRSTAFIRGETELVVTVSPYIVRPTTESAIALPTDGFAPASDLDIYLLGRLHGVYARPGQPAPRGQLKGPIGFIME